MIERFIQIARYCAIGLLCFAVSLGMLAALCEFGHVNYSIAFAASFVLSSALGYRLNGRYTFSGCRRFDRAAMLRYLMVNLALLGVNSILLRVLVETAHIWYIAATVILAALNLPISFIAHQVISYRLGRSNTNMIET